MAELKARKYGAVYERIRDWLLYDGDEKRPSAPKLWEGDQEVYERLVQLRALYFQKAFTYHDALSVMVKQYGLSEATFMRDHNGLIYVFGDLQLESKEFEKIRLREIQFKILQKCLSNNDMKGANASMSNLIKLGGHDRDDADRVPLEMLNPGVYVLAVSESDIGLIRQSLMSGEGVLDLDKMDREAQRVEDIDHEEVNPKAAGQ